MYNANAVVDRREDDLTVSAASSDITYVYSTVDVQIRRDKRVSELISLLPPISDTVARLLGNLAREDFSLPELSALIEKDAALAAQVLRVANSALYARMSEVCSVPHAICVLGAERLRNVALTLSVNRLINQAKLPNSISAVAFNNHCLATATMSDLLAQRVRTSYAEGAFAAGLLHGMGKLLIALALRSEYESLQVAVKTRGCMWADAEKEWMGFSHSEIAGMALQKWKIPAEIRKAVIGQVDAAADGSASLAEVLKCAHDTINALGHGIECCVEPGVELGEPEAIIQRVGCTVAPQVIKDFRSHFEGANGAGP